MKKRIKVKLCRTHSDTCWHDLSKVRVSTLVVTTDYLISINIAIWGIKEKYRCADCKIYLTNEVVIVPWWPKVRLWWPKARPWRPKRRPWWPKGRPSWQKNNLDHDQGITVVTSGGGGHPKPGGRGRRQRERRSTIVTRSYSDALPTVYIS